MALTIFSALILLILADDSKIVLSALFATAFSLVIWSLKQGKGKADKTYVDKNIEDVKNYVKSEIQTHEKNEAIIRDQSNMLLQSIDCKLNALMDKLIPEQSINQTKKK